MNNVIRPLDVDPAKYIRPTGVFTFTHPLLGPFLGFFVIDDFGNAVEVSVTPTVQFLNQSH